MQSATPTKKMFVYNNYLYTKKLRVKDYKRSVDIIEQKDMSNAMFSAMISLKNYKKEEGSTKPSERASSFNIVGFVKV